MDAARKETDKLLAKMERHLNAIYKRANKEIGESWKEYMRKAGERIKPLQDAYEAAKKSGDEALIRKTGKALGQAKREATLMDKHYKAMTERTARELTEINQRATAYINDQLPKVYKTNYNFTAETIEMQTNGAISFELANERAIKNLIDAGDKSLLPQHNLNPAKDVPWNMRNINAEVLQGIMQGESMDKIAKRLERVGLTNAGSAVRTARTIVNTVENKARYDNASAAEEHGVIMKKEWIATADQRTREAHMDAWREYGSRENAIPIDEEFEVGGEKMMYAGDNSASAANVYNCRCSTPYFPVGFTSILPPDKRGSIHVEFE